MTFDQTIQEYILGFGDQLPKLMEGVNVLFPYQSKETLRLSLRFYKKYYCDHQVRLLILGINPGRHGAGLTGIPFTDPKRLAEQCKIPNHLKSHETSSEFIYAMIDEFGGPELFYKQFFISSVSPVGFVKDQKNYNYYDNRKLSDQLKPYIIFQMNRLLRLNLTTEIVFCLGEGKNYQFLQSLNKTEKWFDKIIPLAHPRYIMQYKRQDLKTFINLYINTLKQEKY